MGQTNTERVTHDLTKLPSHLRSFHVSQILDDLAEEDSGAGYSEVLRTGIFVTQIIVWDSSSKIKKRSETVFNRTGVFVDDIVKTIYSEDGASTVSTVTATFSRNANKTVNYVEVVTVRS